MPKRRILIPLLLAASMARAAFGAPQGPSKGPLETAKDLYASARYDEALAVLNDLQPDASAPVRERRSIEQYRSLCLLALGRATEAESAIAQVVAADPTYIPNETDASPRVRGAFSEVRQRLLPDIATAQYTAAKGAFDRKEYAQAEPLFRQVISLDDPDMGGRLGDLKMLSQGFLDLSVAALTPPPAPKKEDPPPPPAPPKPDLNRIYTLTDTDAVPPVAVRQDLPRVPAMITNQAHDRGVIEVVIDEQGRVTSIAIRESVHPIYDNLLVAAARDWRYQPATLDGTPVKYRKLIQVNVTKE
jgi:TonB family protein